MFHKRVFIIFIIAVLFGVISSAYFFFPGTAKHVLTSTAAVAIQSWDDTFGTASSGFVATIGGDANATSSSESADATTTAGQGQDQGGDGDGSLALDSDAQSASSTSPVVVLEVDTSTVAMATDTVSSTPPAVAPPQCTVAASAALSRKLIFNEFAWMGSVPAAGETGTSASNREWMELKNISGAALDISGWQVLDVAGNIKIVFDNGTNIAAGGFFLLERGGDAVPGILADKAYTGALANAGGVFAIVDTACGASDVLDASSGWPAGDNTTKQTMERDADGVGWHTSVPPGGTPRAENSVPAPVVVAPVASSTNATSTIISGGGTTIVDAPIVGTATSTTATSTVTDLSCPPTLDHLVIAVVQIGSASSSANDFIKIFNPTASVVDVGGWKLRKKTGSGADYSLRVFPDGSTVAPGGMFVWANAGDGFGDAMNANVTSTATLAADNSAALMDASGTIVDAVAWGTGTGQYVEGSAFPTDPTAGQALMRRSVGGAIVDTDNNSTDFAL